VVFSLPLGAPTWILYGFAIANTALWRGPLGVFGATAASILAYDVTLGFRTDEAPASALWVVQALVAVGLISAELVYSAVRATAGERDDRARPHRRHRSARRVERTCRACRAPARRDGRGARRARGHAAGGDRGGSARDPDRRRGRGRGPRGDRAPRRWRASH